MKKSKSLSLPKNSLLNYFSKPEEKGEAKLWTEIDSSIKSNQDVKNQCVLQRSKTDPIKLEKEFQEVTMDFEKERERLKEKEREIQKEKEKEKGKEREREKEKEKEREIQREKERKKEEFNKKERERILEIKRKEKEKELEIEKKDIKEESKQSDIKNQENEKPKENQEEDQFELKERKIESRKISQERGEYSGEEEETVQWKPHVNKQIQNSKTKQGSQFNFQIVVNLLNPPSSKLKNDPQKSLLNLWLEHDSDVSNISTTVSFSQGMNQESPVESKKRRHSTSPNEERIGREKAKRNILKKKFKTKNVKKSEGNNQKEFNQAQEIKEQLEIQKEVDSIVKDSNVIVFESPPQTPLKSPKASQASQGSQKSTPTFQNSPLKSRNPFAKNQAEQKVLVLETPLNDILHPNSQIEKNFAPPSPSPSQKRVQFDTFGSPFKRVKIDENPKFQSQEDDFEFSDYELDLLLAVQTPPSQNSQKKTNHTPFETHKNEKSKLPEEEETKQNEPVKNDEVDEQNNLQSTIFNRYLVLEVFVSEYYYGNNQRSNQKVIRIFQEATNKEQYVFLRGDWFSTNVSVGDYVHVVGEFDDNCPDYSSPCCIMDNISSKLFILYPDCLISGTIVSDSFLCLRKTLLSEKLKSSKPLGSAMVYGVMSHELFEKAICCGEFSREYLEREINLMVVQYLHELYAADLTEIQATSALKEVIPKIQTWAEKYFNWTPKPDSKVHLHGSFQMNKPENYNFSINKVLDIEENIWSPKYGLKGKVDVSVQASFHPSSSTKGPNVEPPISRVLPLELKTGNSTSLSHKAQVTLYTLLMSDRYETTIDSGYLYYLKTGESSIVPTIQNEVRGLIIQRNLLAYYLTQSKLPPLTTNSSICARCDFLDSCLIYHKALENGTKETTHIPDLFEQRTSHLSQNHLNYFEEWDRMISREEGDVNRLRKQIWTTYSEERQKFGRCFSRMVLESQEHQNSSHLYQFRCEKSSSKLNTTPTSFLESQIQVGDPVVISTESGQYALAIGFVKELTLDSVTITADRKFSLPLPIEKEKEKENGKSDEIQSQNYQGILELLPNGTNSKLTFPTRSNEKNVLYRIDLDELAAGLGLVRTNLIKMFTISGDEKRRNLIVDLQTPTFRPASEFQSMKKKLPNYDSLNVDQKKAVEKVITANDYAIILGMPGTGKTTTIAYIVQALVSLNKTVLIASYTHSAVDNILLKLKNFNPPVEFIRLGNIEKVHETIKEDCPTQGSSKRVSEIQDLFESKPVVATTCLGINHPLFHKRKFDYVIIDECSQVTQPISIGPLGLAPVFLLVGDPYQLPPLVRASLNNSHLSSSTSTHAINDLPLSRNLSLFTRLAHAHPHAIVNLEHQYRMNSDIMLLSNTLVYNFRLKCGTQEVADSYLPVPHFQDFQQYHLFESTQCNLNSCWLFEALQPRRKVIFFDTDLVPGLETKFGDLTRNEIEATFVQQMVEGLLFCGVQETDIGVISPYRAQLKVINTLLKGREGVEVYTVDKYQGRQKKCIILSFVRSNARHLVGELLRDWRRINVAFTRAEQKMIIFGSKSTLQSEHIFSAMFDILEEQKWIIQLPPNAHLLHKGFNFSQKLTPQTQPSSSKVSKKLSFLDKTPILKNIVVDMYK